MAPIVPYIPETITVHLGAPDAGAENVTVSFSDYVKNVLSSEVYPTWEPAALRANALAVISFALNRVYTEYYRSRGYPFDITSSTAIDQKFINGRNIYENISALVDELFTDYLRRQGYVEPLAAKFCNGVTTTCDGLSQWGSQELAQAVWKAMPAQDAQGVMFIQNTTMTPLVYVAATGTRVWESSCGSGTVALAWYLARKLADGEHGFAFDEPGGRLEARVTMRMGRAVRIVMGGSVLLGEEREIEL